MVRIANSVLFAKTKKEGRVMACKRKAAKSAGSKRAPKYVYFFGNGKAEGNAGMKMLLGGKGANLAEMTNIGIPVPPGFTISTEVCAYYYKHGKKYPSTLRAEIEKNLAKLEKAMKKKFGDPENPLLVSVRSGAPISMPGMMDTILNLGLNDETVEGLAKRANNPRFAWDSYRRFIQMFGNVVLGIEHSKFEHELEAVKEKKGVKLDTELDVDALKEVVERYKALVKKEKGFDLPQDPRKQLDMAIDAVFSSWNNPRAITYRKINEIPDDLGTAVNVQSMVFGNLGPTSGTGVAFTRDPSTGEKRFFGEFLINAQGEDVVAGIRTPEPIDQLAKEMPKVYKQLVQVYKRLEKHYRDMQDLEFTVEDGVLYLLQTRTGKRTAKAAVKIAVDMVKEKLISKEEAVMRVAPSQLDQLLHPMIDPKQDLKVIAKGLPASPGAAVGQVVFTAEEAIARKEKGDKVVLVRLETSPEDVGGMAAAEGILTARGGMTSHAAVVGRGMGKCCVVGCGDITVYEDEKRFVTKDGVEVKEGDWISLNGSTGDVYLGQAKLIEPEIAGEFKQLMKWADSIRELNVRTNADTPHDAQVARDFGAEGIGLCRTEHMFFAEDRIPAVREMIIARDDKEAREKALKKLLPMQKGDFKELFKVMKGLPVTIRLLDPPLHEFLPHTEEEMKELSKQINVPFETIKEAVTELHEFNPMLGHRGCRLGITYPEIYEMQARAIFEAAAELAKEKIKVEPEVMIPLVGHVKELELMKEVVIKAANEVMAEKGVKIKYKVGTMIEVPRAAITADEIAQEADFFSFGTNDLTQMGCGFSRDDSGKFLPEYIEKGIYEKDPFVSLDQAGIGKLMQIAAQGGRSVKEDLKLGICGEHGGDPDTIDFCHRIGLNYVSCSPFRVPIARLAAAQAAIRNASAKKGKVRSKKAKKTKR